MRKVKEVLRLRWECGVSIRTIARSLSVSHGAVVNALRRAEAAGLSWPLPNDLDEATLEAKLYPANREQQRTRSKPNWAEIHQELRSHKGVTLQLLWLEYKRAHPDGYQYSRFCELYRRWAKQLDVVMRQEHRAGEKMFADFAGQTMKITDPKTGQVWEAHVFVAVLGASNYTYAQVCPALDLPSWMDSNTSALAFFAGVPEAIVVDNAKTAVIKACRYEPHLNRTYQEMAAHYGTVILPTRVRRPQDNAKAEVHVQIVERHVLAPLRKRTFFAVSEANEAVWEQLDALNEKPFQKLDGCRRSLYETLDRPALKPLPAERFVYAEWQNARVNIDYHVELDRNFYSVPYTLCKQKVEIRSTSTTVEVLHNGQRVASHGRQQGVGKHSTQRSHMPEHHRQYLEWSPQRLIRWAEKIGPRVAELVQAILNARPHPEQGYRSCLGILRLSKNYPQQRMEAAARRALTFRTLTYRSVRAILERGLDRQPLQTETETPPVIEHEHLRGPDYYREPKGESAGC